MLLPQPRRPTTPARLLRCWAMAATLHLLLLAPPPTAAQGHHHHPAGDGVVISEADYEGLQAIHHDLSDPYGFLRSWNDSGLTACSGALLGVKCVLGSMVGITLPWRGLSGTLSSRPARAAAWGRDGRRGRGRRGGRGRRRGGEARACGRERENGSR
ncbi:unnamed protein product [Urochloa humidicola]